jgi:hypothetical protein
VGDIDFRYGLRIVVSNNLISFLCVCVFGRRKILLSVSIIFISLPFVFSFSALNFCVTIGYSLRVLVLCATFRESFGATFVCGVSVSPFLVLNSLGDSQLVRFKRTLT